MHEGAYLRWAWEQLSDALQHRIVRRVGREADDEPLV